jgi:hypothetical protein
MQAQANRTDLDARARTSLSARHRHHQPAAADPGSRPAEWCVSRSPRHLGLDFMR